MSNAGGWAAVAVILFLMWVRVQGPEVKKQQQNPRLGGTYSIEGPSGGCC